ncbi:hypothetical protein CPC08DRAFT_621102, partial [Agrocybe pediades]
KTRKLLAYYHKDIKQAKFFTKIAPGVPHGIPSSQWERILRGEPLDLHILLSSIHNVVIPQEKQIAFGDTKLATSIDEPKRRVRSAYEWSSAWHLATRATSFLFPHRQDELREYGTYIEGWFTAKHPSLHPKVLLFDNSIRNLVAGGESCRLTDFHKFLQLQNAILVPGGPEYQLSSSQSKPSRGKSFEICNRFNTTTGCPNSDSDCRYKHICKSCRKPGHSQSSC